MKAMKKASVLAAAKLVASTTSRKRPRTRLASVAAPTTPADPTISAPSVDTEPPAGYLPVRSEGLMANHASAAKRHRQAQKRYARNKHVRATVRSALRKARQASEEGSPDAAALTRDAERLLRRASTRGVLRGRTVSRTVSRLQKLLKRAE